MIYKINWDNIAIETFVDESDFILLKWNFKEVEKFKILVVANLLRLSKNPEIGSFDKKNELYSLVISKQTTLFYSFDEKEKIIALHVFWNNQKNPEDLKKLL